MTAAGGVQIGGSGPAALAANVVHRAWEDMVRPSIAWRMNARERSEAISFLTAASGDWAEAREAWCDIAGICPVALREKALNHLAKAS